MLFIPSLSIKKLNLCRGKGLVKMSASSSPPYTNVADEVASTGVDVRHGGDATTVTRLDVGQGSGNIDKTPSMPHDSPLPRVNSLGIDEGSMKLQELMVLYTTLSKKVEKLEKTVKSSQAKRRARFMVSNNEDDLKDPSKQGRKITKIDLDPSISLVQHDAKIQGSHEHDMEFDVDVTKEVSTTEPNVSTVEPVSTACASVTTASVAISTAKDKGKGIMDEFKTEHTKTKLQQEQERLGFEAAVRLQEQLNEEERVEADEEITARLQIEKQGEMTIEERSRLFVELMDKRKKYFALKRAKERRNKPPTQAQQRTYMSNYIKHMGKTEAHRVVSELAGETTKRATEEELVQESSKKQKLDELSQEELQQLMIIVSEKRMNVKPCKPNIQSLTGTFTLKIQESSGNHQYIYILVEREYALSRGVLTQMIVAKLLVYQDNEMSRELLRKIFMLAERPKSGVFRRILS
nr:hypothetical protein [Tanacetum cinerariifolium]